MKGGIESWNALFLIGSVNSLFLGLILWGTRRVERTRKANRFLSLILFSWSFGFFYTWLIETGLYHNYPHFLLIGASFTFLTGPCLYFYAHTTLGGAKRFQLRNERIRLILHFLPFLANTLALVPFYLKSGLEKIQYWEIHRPIDPWFLLMQVFQILHLGAYLILLFLRVRKHRADVGEKYSSAEGLTLDWLRNLALFGCMGLCAYIGVLIIFRYWTGGTEFINRFTDLVVLMILHVLGYKALTQPAILQDEPLVDLSYERSPLTPEEVREIAGRAQTHLRETQAYLDERLSLRDLAMELSLSPHYLSQAINQELGINFFELVNRERIQHAQRLISSSASSLLDIAFSSGFRSKSTFNSLFKKYTGITPSAYRKTLPVTPETQS